MLHVHYRYMIYYPGRIGCNYASLLRCPAWTALHILLQPNSISQVSDAGMHAEGTVPFLPSVSSRGRFATSTKPPKLPGSDATADVLVVLDVLTAANALQCIYISACKFLRRL